MDHGELQRRLMETFLEELDDHVRQFNSDLLELEKEPSQERREQLLQSLFRAAHSLKGASRAVEIDTLESACHALEDLLAAVCDGKRKLSPEVFAMLFRGCDAIEESGMRLRGEQDLQQSPLEELLPELRSFVQPETFEHETSGQADASTAGQAGHDTADQAVHDSGEVPSAAVHEEGSAAKIIAKPSAAGATASPASGMQQRAATASSSGASNVRVAAGKLDQLLAQTGELLVARQRVELGVEELENLCDATTQWRQDWRSVDTAVRRKTVGDQTDSDATRLSDNLIAELRHSADRMCKLERDLGHLVRRSRHTAQQLNQVGSAIEKEVHRARMLPFAEACQGLERAIRDVAASVGKNVRLEIIGADVEVDRSMLERLKDPLLHLTRNAVDHGIEPPVEREAAGKSAEATITIEAALRGGTVEVCVRDDGGGINLKRVTEKAKAKGISLPQDSAELARLIFLPAFSTAAEVSDLSGRGVGLDVVRAEIERLRGSVDVAFQPGCGTCFTLSVPLTLTTIPVITVVASGQTLAIATNNVDRIVRFTKANHATVGGRSALICSDAPIALTGLSLALGLSDDWQLQPQGHMLAVVLSGGGQRVAFAVDEIAAEIEITVKSLGPRVRRLKLVSGASLLPSGEMALVLNAKNLVRSCMDRCDRFSTASSEAIQRARHRLLIVDDSPTSRMLFRSILDSAGYDVSVAADGRQGLRMVREGTFDLVVSDVDMPRLDGIEFTKEVRRTMSADDLPIVLVTARQTETDQARGMHAGASAYIVKSRFDQGELLRTISQLL